LEKKKRKNGTKRLPRRRILKKKRDEEGERVNGESRGEKRVSDKDGGGGVLGKIADM